MNNPSGPTLQIQLASPTEAAHKERYRVDLSKGQTQCPYRHRYPSSDSYTACVLRAGHSGMHCHGYLTPSPKDNWYLR